ncbi:nucleoside diphosphate kinase regulator [Rhodoplanes sp. TEM]|uniref:Nucleoside diphosphate kinase regulator n=1 Tax=Rhodoplanes tepidamans TaxID=200616 RepID=A0ABT5J760_RHOTP|nr:MULTISPECIES: nucleoside diphosphate kinase regulator [Rhodoplanes]MDC7785423.1 nucleoside diphosphate kinase regulator [Rhodoplanes tepidamans]MDC7985796.1 nucleoside diphosphate kinase regulator [Rhodoplanes sp. TEM]MDQ0353123.1 regulator of nucleoside diphosphate kinase [Rhodoplanes tepidamans]
MSTHTLPPIALRPDDRIRLEQLAHANLSRVPETADYLAREVERAQALPPGDSGGDHVAMNSWVTFRDETTGRTRRVMLVYPEQADVSAGRISVLTPIGAALVGLSKGQSIDWTTPSGEERALTVLSVGDEAIDATAPEPETTGTAA